MKNTMIVLLSMILFIFLLLFPRESLEASKYGLILWFDTLLPTLLPFLIVSQLVLKTSAVHTIEHLFGPIFQKIFHCSSKGVFCLICGFLCGYPVGARLISLEVKAQNISLSEGQYLLSFCNNVSPVFCISYGILYGIGTINILPYMLMIYGSAFLFGFLTRPQKFSYDEYQIKKQTSTVENIFQLIDVCMIDSFLIMIKLCGYLILFSLFSNIILLFIPNNTYVTAIVTATLELTGGLSKIQMLPKGVFRSILALCALVFGGFCCIFQTNSVIYDTSLSLKKYILHKIAVTLIALFFFCLWLLFCFFINRRC